MEQYIVEFKFNITIHSDSLNNLIAAWLGYPFDHLFI